MKRRIYLTCLLLIGCVWATAHEFWLEPTRFFAKPGDTVQVRTLVGEGFAGEPSEGKKNRIVQYRHHAPKGQTDLTPTLTGDTYGSVSVSLTQPGTHLLVFANTPKFIELDADKFLAYLREDGLDNVIALRRDRGDTTKPGRELYRRCAKTLIQVGDQPSPTLPAYAPLPLDITPTKNPYALTAGQDLTVQIRFLDKPLTNVRVRYWVKNGTGAVHDEQTRSDSRGYARFRLRPGQNMISVVRMVAAQADASAAEPADWQSYWGSLTFGCR